FVRFPLLSDWPLHWQRDFKEVRRAQGVGLVLGGDCCPLPRDFREAGLGFRGLRFPDLLLHVNYVSNDLRAGDLRSWSIREEGVVIYRHGDHGRGRAAESDGCCRRSVRSLARLYRADALLRVRGVLRLHLAAVEQYRGRGPCFNFGRTLMNASFDLDHAKLAADPRFAAIAHELSALSPINSRESFNRYCREACRFWNCAFPGGIGETKQFGKLLDRIERKNDGVIRTGWGGVVITLHEHPRVEKYLVVRKGGYLALEMHEQKDERLEIREGAGVILWRPPNERSLTVEVLLPGAEFHFQPGMEHCIIGAEDLLVFERSVDPKGMDQDLIFIYEPDPVATRLPSHAC